MMTRNQKIKIIIAREIIFLFFTSILIGLIWLTIRVKSNYYERLFISQVKELQRTETEIDSIERAFPGIVEFDGKIFDRRTFKIDSNNSIDVEQKEIDLFLKMYPNSVEVMVYLAEGDTYDIPLKEVTKFRATFPRAKRLFPNISEKTWNYYETIKKDVLKLKNEWPKSQNQIRSGNSINELTKNIATIILLIIYPIRFIVLVLIWAFKTVKQKV